VKLQVAVIRTFKACLSNRYNDLTYVESFVRNELCVHYLVLTCNTVCKLINSFTWTELHKELR
ncbi:MAG: hypothetical protein ACKO96_47740, partial [Flammeovirgaceae bacterium]